MVELNFFNGIKALVYLFVASFVFIVTYAFFKQIVAMEMSSLASVTIHGLYWLAAVTVVWMGTIWTYQGTIGKNTKEMIWERKGNNQ